LNFLKQKYIVNSGEAAKAADLALTVPPRTTPVKTLHNLKNYGKHIASCFSEPVGDVISQEKIEKIMSYLDSEFSFSTKVFKRKSIFAILDYTNISFDSECLAI